MASVVNRYGTSYFGYTIMKTAPRIMALTVAGAIGLECVGSGFVDALWDSVNKGKQWPDLVKQLQRQKNGQSPLNSVNPQAGFARNVA